MFISWNCDAPFRNFEYLIQGNSQVFFQKMNILSEYFVFCSLFFLCAVCWYLHQLSSVQSLSHVRLFVTPTAAHQASLSITNSWSPPKPMSIESVMPSNHPILCRPLLLLPSIFPDIRIFSNESGLCIRWPKYLSFSFNISPSMNTQD